MIRKRKGGTIGWRVEGGRQGRKNRWIWLPYTIILGFADVVVQLPSCVWLFATPWTAACQASLSLSISGVCPSSCLLHWSYYPAISSSDSLFSLCPQSFPASGTFPVGYLFASDDQNTGASASASVKIPVNIQWTVLFNRRKQQKGKTRDLFRKIGNIKGAFCPRCAE